MILWFVSELICMSRGLGDVYKRQVMIILEKLYIKKKKEMNRLF